MISDQPVEHICKSCSNTFTGRYCNQCGEKVIEPKDRQFRTFLGNVMIATTFVDNRFIKSLWLTIRRPGFLSREYVDGRRIMYMRPLQMFFILNLIYFLFPVLQMFNSTLYTQTHVLPHRKLAMSIVEHKIKKEHFSIEGFELMYNDKTKSLAKLLIVLFVILASVPLSIIFLRRNRFFTDHVALSVELTSFNLAVNAIFLSIVFALLSKVLKLMNIQWQGYLNDLTLTVLFVATNVYFIFRAGRVFYNQKGKRLILKSLAGILGLFLALEAYRFLLFFITVWAI